jgi:hypothetical protein
VHQDVKVDNTSVTIPDEFADSDSFGKSVCLPWRKGNVQGYNQDLYFSTLT